MIQTKGNKFNRFFAYTCTLKNNTVALNNSRTQPTVRLKPPATPLSLSVKPGSLIKTEKRFIFLDQNGFVTSSNGVEGVGNSKAVELKQSSRAELSGVPHRERAFSLLLSMTSAFRSRSVATLQSATVFWATTVPLNGNVKTLNPSCCFFLTRVVTKTFWQYLTLQTNNKRQLMCCNIQINSKIKIKTEKMQQKKCKVSYKTHF